MGIRMPGLDGLEATTKTLSQDNSIARIIIPTTFDTDKQVCKALLAGANVKSNLEIGEVSRICPVAVRSPVLNLVFKQ